MKSTYSYVKAPTWCPDAVASREGWRHPRTGELLVSIPGGLPIVESIINEVESKPVINEKVQEKVILDETTESITVLDEVIEEKPVIEETVVPKARAAKTTRKKKESNE